MTEATPPLSAEESVRAAWKEQSSDKALDGFERSYKTEHIGAVLDEIDALRDALISADDSIERLERALGAALKQRDITIRSRLSIEGERDEAREEHLGLAKLVGKLQLDVAQAEQERDEARKVLRYIALLYWAGEGQPEDWDGMGEQLTELGYTEAYMQKTRENDERDTTPWELARRDVWDLADALEWALNGYAEASLWPARLGRRELQNRAYSDEDRAEFQKRRDLLDRIRGEHAAEPAAPETRKDNLPEADYSHLPQAGGDGFNLAPTIVERPAPDVTTVPTWGLWVEDKNYWIRRGYHTAREAGIARDEIERSCKYPADTNFMIVEDEERRIPAPAPDVAALD